jgi:deoxyribodipyrimidine photo-lyase
MHKSLPVIFWLRQDLRIADNPALHNAVETCAPILPIFILDDGDEWRYGGAQRVALHHALRDLSAQLKKAGATLILRRGDSQQILTDVIKETGATEVFWNRRYEPWAVQQDIEIKKNIGIPVQSFNGKLLAEPWEIKTGQGGPYKVFTPYWRTMQAVLSKKHPIIYPTTHKIHGFTASVKSDNLDDWKLLPDKPDWSGGIEKTWEFTEAGAHKILHDFIDDKIAYYSKERDFPTRPHAAQGALGQLKSATSELSPYLALGKISPRQIWYEITMAMHDGRIKPGHHDEAEKYLRQIVWREFSYHLLFHFPHTAHEPLNPKFAKFPWRNSKKDLQHWQKGQTGYPLVDAGMRQLWQTGWMHNRVRLVTASFLVKHLLLPWQDGAAWFWDTLVDADLANNTMGWQWTAGSGADAAPYFRIFNPITQSEKFNAADYIRQYVPELKDMPDKYIHAPFDAPKQILAESGVVLGKTYPHPIVEHKAARERALDALKETK